MRRQVFDALDECGTGELDAQVGWLVSDACHWTRSEG
jgi:hypothetical protein